MTRTTRLAIGCCCFLLSIGIAAPAYCAEQADAHSVSSSLFAWEHLFSWSGLISIFTLSALMSFFSVDNGIYMCTIIGQLPNDTERNKAYRYGFWVAGAVQVLLLLIIACLSERMIHKFVHIDNMLGGESIELSLSDLMIICGGLFLIVHSGKDIYREVEHPEEEHQVVKKPKTIGGLMCLIGLGNVIFSVDGVFTALGTSDSFYVMVIATVVALFAMKYFTNRISAYLQRHPALKVLAYTVLVLVGFKLFCEGFGSHIPSGYINTPIIALIIMDMVQLRQANNRAKLAAAEKSAAAT